MKPLTELTWEDVEKVHVWYDWETNQEYSADDFHVWFTELDWDSKLDLEYTFKDGRIETFDAIPF